MDMACIDVYLLFFLVCVHMYVVWNLWSKKLKESLQIWVDVLGYETLKRYKNLGAKFAVSKHLDLTFW